MSTRQVSRLAIIASSTFPNVLIRAIALYALGCISLSLPCSRRTTVISSLNVRAVALLKACVEELVEAWEEGAERLMQGVVSDTVNA